MLCKLLLSTVLVIFAMVTAAGACTFTWDAVGTYTDGTVVTEQVSYRLHFKPAGSAVWQTVADVNVATATLVCAAGQYYVTAYTASAAESAASNTVTLQQATTPVNLRWTR
jgi:hypothetical protein